MFRTPMLKTIARLVQEAYAEEAQRKVLEERREFLKSSLATSAAFLPLAGLAAGCASQLRLPSEVSGSRTAFAKNDERVVILGAGLAGLTAAYRLAKAGCPGVIYEASPRIGGRMFTKSNFNSDGMTCELGGELIDTNHEDLLALCRELGVSVGSFADEDKKLAQAIYYFGGRRTTDKELIRHFKPLAQRLARDQAKAFPDSLPEGSVTEYARQLDNVCLADYLDRFHDVDRWVVDLIRTAYVGEMALEAEDQSAIGMISTLSADTKDGFKIYGESDQAWRILGGNVVLIDALKDYLQKAGVVIHTGRPLVAISETAAGLRMDFRGEGSDSVVAQKVVCTIPFSTLRLVDGVSKLNLDPAKQKCISEMVYGTSSKLMLGYRSRPWRHGIVNGRVHVPASNGMVYTDLGVQNIWETSRLQKGPSGILTCYVGGRLGASLGVQNSLSFRGQVDEVFPGTDKQFDSNLACFNWSQYSFNRGSYAGFRPGQTFLFNDVAGKTELGGKLLFAGEHTAGKFAGFLNGACRSGNVAAAEILKEVSKSKIAV